MNESEQGVPGSYMPAFHSHTHTHTLLQTAVPQYPKQRCGQSNLGVFLDLQKMLWLNLWHLRLIIYEQISHLKLEKISVTQWCYNEDLAWSKTALDLAVSKKSCVEPFINNIPGEAVGAAALSVCSISAVKPGNTLWSQLFLQVVELFGAELQTKAVRRTVTFFQMVDISGWSETLGSFVWETYFRWITRNE